MITVETLKYIEMKVALDEAIEDAGGIKNFECANGVTNVSDMRSGKRRISTGVALALGYRRTKDGYEKLTIKGE